MNLSTASINNELVSVNITTYDRSRLLARCLDSVLRQTYEYLEINIVDDCSNDNTEEVVKGYQLADRRINYYRHKKNKGNAAARNTAFLKSSGIFTAFLDDDDEWIDDRKIEKQLDVFRSSNDPMLGVVCTGILRTDINGENRSEKANRPKNLVKTMLRGGLIHNSTAFLRSNVIRKVGCFDEKMPRGVDSEFFRRVVIKYGYHVHFMEDITCRYYENSPNRMTSKVSNRNLIAVRKANSYLLRKYFWTNLRYPSVFFYRMKTVVKTQTSIVLRRVLK
ncbi:glycosyltransferase family 2 protein [Puniceicoccus vermicola]|uniref:Glycosyltransferase family 2 protein n=1 Tax=Puniceicoccus vermicola TaxID=388746 RepID=A0A7X1AWL4_9BACT|nr:glycosyltransferase family 2 protein [Puniceicoccus vermicola]MBC2601187.1 glycosyltransferase family 2 protein [Puniceicoccus vermicola]